MNREQFINHVRFLSNDGTTSNLIQREKLSVRPGNTFDGINTVFQLHNRRICGFTLYNAANQEVSASEFTLVSATGRLIMGTAPTDPNSYTDYYFQKLDDTELTQAISGAAATAGFNPDSVQPGNLDFCALYSLAYAYMAMASKCGEYYTISSAGKQVSKSEQFNHYQGLASTTLAKATELRRDMYTDRGTRDQAAEAHTAASWVSPYIADSGGG